MLKRFLALFERLRPKSANEKHEISWAKRKDELLKIMHKHATKVIEGRPDLDVKRSKNYVHITAPSDRTIFQSGEEGYPVTEVFITPVVQGTVRTGHVINVSYGPTVFTRKFKEGEDIMARNELMTAVKNYEPSSDEGRKKQKRK